MPVLTITNQKGGVGKSTLAIHWAWRQMDRGNRVAHIDLDAQGNSSSIFRDKAASAEAADLFSSDAGLPEIEAGDIATFVGTPALTQIERGGSAELQAFVDNIEALQARADQIVIDTAPADGVRMIAALLAATHVLAPIDLDLFAMQGVERLLQRIYGVKKENKRMVFLGLLPNRVNANDYRHKNAFMDLRSSENFGGFLVPRLLKTRVAYGEAIRKGVPVWELNTTSGRDAGAEILDVFETLEKKMEG